MNYTDPDTGLDTLTKQPAEDRLYNIPFDQELRSGDTLASVSSVTFANLGEVSGSTDITIAGSPANDNTNVQPQISAGQDLENYKITAVAVSTNGDTLEVDVMLYVRD